MEEWISKSQKKREADALQKIGLKLVGLSSTILDKIALPPDLRQAIDAAKTIRGNGGIRRQTQLIGKIIRSVDSQLIEEIQRTWL